MEALRVVNGEAGDDGRRFWCCGDVKDDDANLSISMLFVSHCTNKMYLVL